MTKRKGFSPEFRREAVRLLETALKSSADIDRELGVRGALYASGSYLELPKRSEMVRSSDKGIAMTLVVETFFSSL